MIHIEVIFAYGLRLGHTVSSLHECSVVPALCIEHFLAQLCVLGSSLDEADKAPAVSILQVHGRQHRRQLNASTFLNVTSLSPGPAAILPLGTHTRLGRFLSSSLVPNAYEISRSPAQECVSSIQTSLCEGGGAALESPTCSGWGGQGRRQKTA